MRYAHVHSELNIVLQILELDFTPVNPNFVVLDPEEVCYVSWVFDSNATPRFKEPIAVQSWTAYQFLLRFTAEERAAFRAAALTDPMVADFQQLAQAAQEVINNDPMTIAGMNYLVSVNLLTEQRKNEILGV